MQRGARHARWAKISRRGGEGGLGTIAELMGAHRRGREGGRVRPPPRASRGRPGSRGLRPPSPHASPPSLPGGAGGWLGVQQHTAGRTVKSSPLSPRHRAGDRVGGLDRPSTAAAVPRFDPAARPRGGFTRMPPLDRRAATGLRLAGTALRVGRQGGRSHKAPTPRSAATHTRRSAAGRAGPPWTPWCRRAAMPPESHNGAQAVRTEAGDPMPLSPTRRKRRAGLATAAGRFT